MTLEQFLIYLAVALSVANALLPLAKSIAAKTKTRTDDDVIEILEEAISIGRSHFKPKK